MRRLGLATVACIAALSLMAACSDDDTTKSKNDKGSIQLDDGGTQQDTGGTTGDQGATGNEGGVAGDSKVPTGDGAVAQCDAKIVGKACTKDGKECGSSHTCLLTASDGKGGVCTCLCTADNSKTPLINEDTCPGATTTKASVCGAVSLSDGSTKNFCFKTCKPKLGGNDCSSPMYCHPRSGASIGQFSLAVCLFSGGCTKNSECGVTNGTLCDKSKTPTGCKTGETCSALTTNGTAGMCTVDGKCDTKSGLCGVHTVGKSTAKVGDPCKSGKDCAGNQSCQIEFDETKYLADAGKTCKADGDCCSGKCSSGTCAVGEPCKIRNRNGYCSISGCGFAKTLTQFACDSGSVCNTLYSGGVCQKTCDLKTATTCRNNAKDFMGDYECRGWNNLSIGGSPIVAKPVCDFGYSMSCDMLKNSSLDCTSVGLQSNPTKMGCRDAKNTKLTNKYDPKGWCFDDTASGTVKK